MINKSHKLIILLLAFLLLPYGILYAQNKRCNFEITKKDISKLQKGGIFISNTTKGTACFKNIDGRIIYYPIKNGRIEGDAYLYYYIPVSANGRFAGNVGTNTSTLQCYIPTGKAMRAKPSLTVSQNITIVGYVHTGAYNDSAASMSVMDADANGVRIQISGSKQIGSSTYASVIVAITTPFGLSADLEG